MKQRDVNRVDALEKRDLQEGYRDREMANDAEHEREGKEWCEALIADAAE